MGSNPSPSIWILDVCLTLFVIMCMSEMTSSAIIKRNKVILVSMDGFRYDYLSKTNNTPHFDRMESEGVTMPFMNATYVTLTFPCHYSMATGLYEESHGIIANNMYDPEFDAYFRMSTTEARWWDGGEPIWASARRAGLKSGAFFWPGSSSPYKGVRPNEWRNYDGSVSYEERVSTVVRWMAEDDFDLAVLYFDEPDHTGHFSGPDSPEVVSQIERMDGILGMLFQELDKAGILNRVNLIVTSDHGMAPVNTKTQLIDLLDYTNSTYMKRMVQGGPIASIFPQPGETEALKDDLAGANPHMTVVYKDEIPEGKHYKNNRRVAPIIAIADEGWQVTTNRTYRLEWPFLGDHGYDNDLMSMKPIFFAWGPDFKTGEVVDPIKNIDIYPLICHLLDIEPAPNNGSLERASQLLKHSVTVEDSGNSGSSGDNSFARSFLILLAWMASWPGF